MKKEPTEVIEYVDDLKEKLLSVHETVHHKIQMASDRMKTRYDLKGNSVGFQAGDLQYSTRAEDENEDCPFRPPQ